MGGHQPGARPGPAGRLNRDHYNDSPISQAPAAASEERIAARGDPVPPVAPDAVDIQANATFGFFDDTEHLFPLMRTITAPALIGGGDPDDAFPIRDSVVLLEMIPDADLVVPRHQPRIPIPEPRRLRLPHQHLAAVVSGLVPPPGRVRTCRAGRRWNAVVIQRQP